MASKELNYWPGTEELTKPAKKVARMIGVHPNTLFHWIKSGQIECVRYSSKSIHFTFKQVSEFLEARKDRVKLPTFKD